MKFRTFFCVNKNGPWWATTSMAKYLPILLATLLCTVWAEMAAKDCFSAWDCRPIFSWKVLGVFKHFKEMPCSNHAISAQTFGRTGLLPFASRISQWNTRSSWNLARWSKGPRLGALLKGIGTKGAPSKYPRDIRCIWGWLLRVPSHTSSNGWFSIVVLVFSGCIRIVHMAQFSSWSKC